MILKQRIQLKLPLKNKPPHPMKKTSIIIFTLFFWGCQKADLKKDGYFVFKANGKNVSFNTCMWWVESYMVDTIPVNMNYIFAIQRKDIKGSEFNWQADHVYIVFDGTSPGTYSTFGMMSQPGAFYIEIVYKGLRYDMLSAHPYDIKMDIGTYDVNKGKIEGNISGTFYDNTTDNAIEITHCDFCARN